MKNQFLFYKHFFYLKYGLFQFILSIDFMLLLERNFAQCFGPRFPNARLDVMQKLCKTIL